MQVTISGFILTTSTNPPPAWRTRASCARVMKRLLCFSLFTWASAAILLLGHSTGTIALSGAVALAGFDLLRP